MAAHVCEPIGDFLCPKDRPSPIFSTFAAGINFISGVWALIVALTGDCDATPRTWLLLGCANCAVNFGFAFYIYHRFAAKVRGDEDTPGLAPGDAACKLFMYDWGVCLYLAALLWQLIWFFLSLNVAGDYDNDKCARQLSTAAVILAIFAGVGVVLIILSLFTECCKQPSWQQHHRERQRDPITTAATAATSVAAATTRATRGVIGRIFGSGNNNRQQQHQPQYQQPYGGSQYPPQHTPQHQTYGQPASPYTPSPPPPVPQQPQQASYYGGGGAAESSGMYSAPPSRNPNYQPQYA